MTNRAGSIPADQRLLERIQSLLEDDAHANDPLRTLLLEIMEYIQAQNQRMERLLKIADGYQLLERNQTLSLAERCDKQIKRMEKLARISDQYQRNLLEASESLRQAANQDSLTGLANRRHLMERLKEESQRATRRGTRLAVAMMDVDHFKQINDRFGHEIGDLALREIADAVRQGMRGYDIHGRWGGEEFLLMLPETDQSEAVAVLERIRAQIGTIRVGGDEARVRLSASFGITHLRHGEDTDDTLKRADDALFKAKRNGRNRIEIAD